VSIAVVILNWNGRKLLEKFLPSVIEYSEHASIYVVDNASEDDSVSFLKQHYPMVKIIQHQTNGGFAKGYNDALDQIDSELFCLLNNDVEVTSNWLDPIIALLNNEPETVIVQPKILDHKQKDHFEYAGAAGGFIDKYGFPFCRGRIFNTIEKDCEQFDDIASIFWASGACLFIRKNTYHQLNGFDEAFFAHMEEIDLCWRAFNLGLQIKYVGQSKVYHVGGATLSETNPKKTYLNFRNSLYMLTKNVRSKKLFTTLFVKLVLDGIAGITFLFQGKPMHSFAVLKSHVSFYRRLPILLRQRNTVPNNRNYFQTKSIVWSYYITKNKTFKSL